MRKIKKTLKLVLVIIFTGYLNVYSQGQCLSYNLTDNPYICGLYGDANGVSNWDWEVDREADFNKHCKTWQARTQQGNALTVMGSPFYDSQTSELDKIALAKDYTRAKGWELLRRNFGCQSEASYPYFMLYNKWTGLLRIFIYQPVHMPQYSSILVEMSPSKAPYPATSSLGDAQITAPDKHRTSTSASEFSRKLIAVTEGSGSGNWRVAEMNMGFDPEIQSSIYSGSGLNIILYGITSSSVKARIKGRSTSSSDPLIFNYSYGTNKQPVPDDDSKKFQATGEKFIKFSKTLNESKDQVFNATNKIINALANIPYGQGIKGRIKDIAWSVREIASSTSGFGKFLGNLSSAIGGAGAVLNVVGGVIGLFEGGANEPAAMPTYTVYDMELEGEITAKVIVNSFLIRVPGTEQTNNSNATYYQCPLGIFNIKNTPQADVVTYERQIGSPLKSLRKYFVSYRMRNTLEVSYNSGAGLELVSVKAAIVGEVKGDASNNNIAIYDLLADHVPISGPFNLMLPDLYAGLLETTTYDTEKNLHSFQTPYVNVECLNGLAFNARAETNIFLRVKAILKKKNDPDNTPIYFIRDYKIETHEAEYPEDLRERHRSFTTVKSTPTPYSNYSELPYYVDDKIINGVTYTTSAEEKTDNSIKTENNVTITAGQSVLFKTGYEITLNDEFTAEVGSEFLAELKVLQLDLSCGTPVREPYEHNENCYNTTVFASRVETDPDKPVYNQSISEEDIKVFPVPTNSKLYIDGINVNGTATITILDQSGRSVKEVRSPSFDGGRIDLDVSSLSNGVYFVKIQTLDQIITRKIVVSK